MLLGTLLSGVTASLEWKKDGGPAAFKRLRQQVGRASLLGLELLVAAHIIRTVSEVPSLTGVSILAVIVLIRTFLSFAAGRAGRQVALAKPADVAIGRADEPA